MPRSHPLTRLDPTSQDPPPLHYNPALLEAEACGAERGLTEADLIVSVPDATRLAERLAAEITDRTHPVLSLPFRTDLLEACGEVARQFAGGASPVPLYLIGIGGSALGARMTYTALTAGAPAPHPWRFLDTLDPARLAAAAPGEAAPRPLPLPEEGCYCLISKSGSTLETTANAEIVLDQLRQRLPEAWPDRVVCITQGTATPLGAFAERHGCHRLLIPRDVPGRFSLFTPAGLFPALVGGLDAEALLTGARDAVEAFAAEGPDADALLAARHQLALMKKGGRHRVVFNYAAPLQTAAAWFAQLWNESLGKEGRGQLLVPAAGPADQHSLLQLLAEGPPDAGVTFWGLVQPAVDLPISKDLALPLVDKPLGGISLHQLVTWEREATARSLAEAGCPSATLTLFRLDAYHLGYLAAFLQLETICLGELLGIDWTSQPGVERGKQLISERLRAHHKHA